MEHDVQPAARARRHPRILTAGAVCWGMIGSYQVLVLILSPSVQLALSRKPFEGIAFQAALLLVTVLPFAVAGLLVTRPSRGTIIASGVLAGLWGMFGLVALLNGTPDDTAIVAGYLLLSALAGILSFLGWSQVGASSIRSSR